MAAYWKLNKSLNKQIAPDEILKIVAFEEENFGFHIHSDLEIAQEILRSYFNIENTTLEYDIDIQDIKKHLANDSVVIAPMNGKKLKNPHFLNGGPQNHMILIIGYDDKEQVFITMILELEMERIMNTPMRVIKIAFIIIQTQIKSSRKTDPKSALLSL